MITTWFHPDWSGDFRLEADGDDKCVLTVKAPTAAEVERLGKFLKRARSKAWVAQHVGFQPNGEVVVPIAASLVKAGKALLGRRVYGTLTAVVSTAGVVEATVNDADKAAAAAAKKNAAKAATVKRPTLCCPLCEPGPDTRANEVLLAFCTPAQRATWERDGRLVCYGDLSGRAYEVVHRHHSLAIKRGKIAYDLEGGYVMHAYDWSVPPAEEALAVKLVLEHAEPWIRNASGCTHGDGPIYYNPFVDDQYSDGTTDASLMSAIGAALALFAPVEKRL